MAVRPTSMMLAGDRLGPVRLRVASLDRSVAWYREVLGLRPSGRAPRAAEVSLQTLAGETLVQLVETAGADPHPPRGRLGLFHFAVLLPDRAALGRFYLHARALEVPLGAADHVVSEALYLTDPDGLGIEVYADRPREVWPSGGTDRVRMDTLPLDAESLARAAGDRALEGAPAGTRIGHVHLHVGDLADAEAFYADLLGLPVTMRGYPGALFLGADGYHHHLGVNTWAGPGASPPGDSDACLLEWELGVSDGHAWTELRERLSGAGDAAALYLADPWGTRVRLLRL